MKSPELAFTFALCTIFPSCFGSAADAQGSVMVYNDIDCISPHGTSIPLSADVCLETSQTAAISIVSLPSCGNGQPVLYISDLENRGKPSFSPAISSGKMERIVELC